MKASELRKSILQAAVQGKLVSQNPQDEPASELYKRIQAEKGQLIKDKKLKKEKPLPAITADEIPFDLPDGWMWCRLGEVVETNIGLIYKPSEITKSGVPVLRSNNVQNGRIILEDLVYIKKEIDNKFICQKNDILMCVRNGSKRLVGKAALIDESGMAFGAFMAILRTSFSNYLLTFINSIVFRKQVQGNDTNTTTINQITQSLLKNVFIPLPPLEEQKRIVAKVDGLMILCDELEKAEKIADGLDKNFFTNLPKAILQSAIKGELVPQCPTDEPASELYKRIQAEKEQLIRDKKLKKEKPLPAIAEDEIPFDLPDGWIWCRLGDIINYGNTINIKPTNISPEKWVLELEDIEKDSGNIIKRVTAQFRVPKSDKHVFSKNNILYSKLRPYLNKVTLADSDGVCSSEIIPLVISTQLNSPYLLSYFRSPFFVDYAIKCSYGVKMPRLGTTDGKLAIIPLPPLEEQKRIVAKVDELMALCSELKTIK